MENRTDFKEEKFDSFLNKTIILSSKKYYKKEITRNLKELRIIDDENYEEFMKDYLKIDEEVYNRIDIGNFIDVFNNSALVSALKSLSNIEMTVIFLLFQEDLSLDDAAKILEICSKSVSRIKLRAIDKLKKYFKGDQDYEK